MGEVDTAFLEFKKGFDSKKNWRFRKGIFYDIDAQQNYSKNVMLWIWSDLRVQRKEFYIPSTGELSPPWVYYNNEMWMPRFPLGLFRIRVSAYLNNNSDIPKSFCEKWLRWVKSEKSNLNAIERSSYPFLNHVCSVFQKYHIQACESDALNLALVLFSLLLELDSSKLKYYVTTASIYSEPTERDALSSWHYHTKLKFFSSSDSLSEHLDTDRSRREELNYETILKATEDRGQKFDYKKFGLFIKEVKILEDKKVTELMGYRVQNDSQFQDLNNINDDQSYHSETPKM